MIFACGQARRSGTSSRWLRALTTRAGSHSLGPSTHAGRCAHTRPTSPGTGRRCVAPTGCACRGRRGHPGDCMCERPGPAARRGLTWSATTPFATGRTSCPTSPLDWATTSPSLGRRGPSCVTSRLGSSNRCLARMASTCVWPARRRHWRPSPLACRARRNGPGSRTRRYGLPRDRFPASTPTPGLKLRAR
jgi:hypothetical protein